MIRLFAAASLATVLLIFGGMTAPASAGVDKWTTNGPFGGPSYVVAADPKSPATLYEASPGGGVFKSTDRGQNWSYAGTGLTDPTCLTLAIDPVQPKTLYTAGGNGIFKSTNGAATWKQVSAEVNVTQIVIDPASPSTLYAKVFEGGVLKSTNGGVKWVAAGPASQNVYALAIDPKTPTTIYAGAYEGLFKSTNGGATWTLHTKGLGTYPTIYALTVDPVDTAILYGSADVVNSSNPNEADSEVIKSTDGGASWASSSGGIPAGTYLGTIAVDPKKSNIVYAGASFPAGLFVSRNSGASWSKSEISFPKGFEDDEVLDVAIDPSAPANVFAATASGIYASADRGGSWSAANHGLANTQVTAVAVNPTTPTTVYAGTENDGMFKSVDGGGTWARINSGLTSPFGNAGGPSGPVSAIAIDPATPKILYISSEAGAGVLKSVDAGSSWTSVSSGLMAYKDVYSLAIDPQAPSTLFAGLDDDVLMTKDGGKTWIDVGTGLQDIQPTTLLFGSTEMLAVGASDGGFSAFITPYKPGSTSLKWTPACSSAVLDFVAGYSGKKLTAAQVRTALKAFGFSSAVLSAVASACPSAQSNVFVRLALAGARSAMMAIADAAGVDTTYCRPYTGFALAPAKSPSIIYGTGGCGVLEATNTASKIKALNTNLPVNLVVNGIAAIPTGKTLYIGTQGHGVYKYAISP